jgi:hypothetical protein
MESIIGNGGFHFKDTVVTGDPLDKIWELRKNPRSQVGY